MIAGVVVAMMGLAGASMAQPGARDIEWVVEIGGSDGLRFSYRYDVVHADGTKETRHETAGTVPAHYVVKGVSMDFSALTFDEGVIKGRLIAGGRVVETDEAESKGFGEIAFTKSLKELESGSDLNY